jgi:hypothetical protein
MDSNRDISRETEPVADKPERVRNIFRPKGLQNEKKMRVLGLNSLSSAYEFLSHNTKGDQEETLASGRVSEYQNQLGDLSQAKIMKQLVSYLKNQNLDSKSDFSWNRQTFSQFMLHTYGIRLSQQYLTEAIYACRGKDLEKSNLQKDYDINKLVQWIYKQLPHLLTFNTIKKMR